MGILEQLKKDYIAYWSDNFNNEKMPCDAITWVKQELKKRQEESNNE